MSVMSEIDLIRQILQESNAKARTRAPRPPHFHLGSLSIDPLVNAQITRFTVDVPDHGRAHYVRRYECAKIGDGWFIGSEGERFEQPTIMHTLRFLWIRAKIA
jgi:hypothetical protein